MTDIRARLADALREPACKEMRLPYGPADGWVERLVDVLLSLPDIAISDVEIEGDYDPYYSWQEDMTHLAAVDRISYGEWLRREVMAAAVQAQEEQP